MQFKTGTVSLNLRELELLIPFLEHEHAERVFAADIMRHSRVIKTQERAAAITCEADAIYALIISLHNLH